MDNGNHQRLDLQTLKKETKSVWKLKGRLNGTLLLLVTYDDSNNPQRLGVT